MKINGTDFRILAFKGMSFEKFEAMYKKTELPFPRKETFEKIQKEIPKEEKRLAAEKKAAEKTQKAADKAAEKETAAGK